jgi:complex iron-sulfur molybdoenzyme family reductase subunit gamma
MRHALAGLLLALPAAAAALPASETVPVQELAAPLPGDPGAPAWDALPPVALAAAPQRSIRLHDAAANRALAAAGPRQVRVRAATDGADLALLLEWDDATEDRARPDATDAYGDAAAVEFPARFGAGVRLPYVGMGDEDEHVVLYLSRATAAGASLRQAVAAGFGSLTRADLGEARAAMRYDPARRAWRALLVRPLAGPGHDLRRGLIPFSVAVWDGAGHERGGNKALTAWKFLRLSRFPLDQAWEAELSWGYGQGELGDAGRGRELVEAQCAVCHTIGDQEAAPGLAPALTGIGVVATPGYLRDSIVAPSRVIVPSVNPRQHQDRSKPLDARRAFAPDEAWTWFTVADGKKSSTMPDFATLSPQEVADAVAYLKTLGAEPPGGRTP